MQRSYIAAVLIVWSAVAAAEEPAKVEAPVLVVEKSTAPPKCEIKPVMTDDELRACGARIPR
jgi:hypothetical protein